MGLPYNQNVRLELISTTLGHSHTIRKQIVTQIQMDEKLACLWKTNYRYSDVICEAFLFSLSYFCAWSKLDSFDSTKNRKKLQHHKNWFYTTMQVQLSAMIEISFSNVLILIFSNH